MALILSGTDGVQDNSGAIESGTAITLTNQTAPAFTDIPSWAKRVTLMFRGVSTNGTSNWLIQLGTGSTPTYTTSGYLGSTMRLTDATATAGANPTTGFGIAFISAAAVAHGSIILSLVDASTNAWAAAGTLGNSNASSVITTNGSVALSGALTAVRLYIDGTQQFDAGTINIIYE